MKIVILIALFAFGPAVANAETWKARLAPVKEADEYCAREFGAKEFFHKRTVFQMEAEGNFFKGTLTEPKQWSSNFSIRAGGQVRSYITINMPQPLSVLLTGSVWSKDLQIQMGPCLFKFEPV